jgi:hypothetical protein
LPGGLAPQSWCNANDGETVTGDESRQLNVGERVSWNADPKDHGTITEKNWAGVTITWDNRSEQAILYNDMAHVQRTPTKLM